MILYASLPAIRDHIAAEARNKVNAPEAMTFNEWYRGFTVGALRAARIIEGDQK